MKTSLTAIGLVVSAAVLGASPGFADTLDVGNRLNNAGFGTDVTTLGDPLLGWVTTSGTVNQRNVGNAINADSSTLVDERNTFDSFFTTGPFLVLGDAAGVIGGDNQSGTHGIIQHFRTPGAVQDRDVLDLSLNLSFDYVFDGITDLLAQTNAPADSFTVSLQRLRTNGNNGPIDTIFSRELGIDTLSQFDGHTSIPLTLEIGALYRLSFSLFEDNLQVLNFNRQAFNSAVGLDNVRIEGTAEVAALPEPVPLPPAAYLMASAIAALGIFGRRRSTPQA